MNLTLSEYLGSTQLPRAPTCTLIPREPLLPGTSDHILGVLVPPLVYALSSGVFHLLDRFELFTQYRIHPPKQDLQRNHVTRWQCLQNVVRYQVMQIAFGLMLSYYAEPEMHGNKKCDIHNWAVYIRYGSTALQRILALLGLDAKGLTSVVSKALSRVLSTDANSLNEGGIFQTSEFSPAELLLANLMISFVVPAFQFVVALAVVDTWIYFTHRIVHANKTLYKIVHAQHHQLYVTYAYGAVYAHWLESLFLDIVSFLLANAIAGFSPRQSMLFGSLATIKTISDHCGYVFPGDPFNYMNSNGARFHDLHHQAWGLKYNFATYTAFWDKLLGTAWTDVDGAAARYARKNEAMKARASKT